MSSTEVLGSSEEVARPQAGEPGCGISTPTVIERPRVTMQRPPVRHPHPPLFDFEPWKNHCQDSGKKSQIGSIKERSACCDTAIRPESELKGTRRAHRETDADDPKLTSS
jgi:hypothetical protein